MSEISKVDNQDINSYCMADIDAKEKEAEVKQPVAETAAVAQKVLKFVGFQGMTSKSLVKQFPNMKPHIKNVKHIAVDVKNGIVKLDRNGSIFVFNTSGPLLAKVANHKDADKKANEYINR